jgi:hypothetical protein
VHGRTRGLRDSHDALDCYRRNSVPNQNRLSWRTGACCKDEAAASGLERNVGLIVGYSSGKLLPKMRAPGGMHPRPGVHAKPLTFSPFGATLTLGVLRQ